jgi:hypothetical protein
MMIAVLQMHDTQPNKETMRKFVNSVINAKINTVSIKVDLSETLNMSQETIPNLFSTRKPLNPKIGFSFEELVKKEPQPSTPLKAKKIDVIDLTKKEKDLLNQIAESRQTLLEIRKMKTESYESPVAKCNTVSSSYVDNCAGTYQNINDTVKLEIPRVEFERLCKMVSTYEKSRIKSREYAQKKNERDREEKNAKLMEAGLEELVKKSRKREEPLIKEMNLCNYIVN